MTILLRKQSVTSKITIACTKILVCFLEDLSVLILGFEAMMQDPKTCAKTKAKLKGYHTKLTDYRKLALCVAYRELLDTIVPASKVLEGV